MPGTVFVSLNKYGNRINNISSKSNIMMTGTITCLSGVVTSM